jgi:cytochrome c oxidase cbb3-type subunit 3
MPNPYEGDPQAIQQGKALYIRMNCAGCHAYSGKGNMGPNLTDTYWRYGGLPIQVYKSIRDGRPEGMPSWGVALPPSDIWKLVAYVQSLGGTVSPKNYAHSRQGDQPGEQVAPEAQSDADAGSAVALPVPAESSPAEPRNGSSTPAKRHSGEPKPPQERGAGGEPRP